MSFDPAFFLMQREGYITRSCICTAFNELLSATVNQKGRYYTSFFQLAIGIERTQKLAIILDHMIDKNLHPPGENAIRRFSHDLLKLHDKASSIAKSRAITAMISFDLKPLHHRMLAFVSDFANGARYANLTALASGHLPKDPLEDWEDIMWNTFREDVDEEKNQSILQEAAERASVMQDCSTVMAHDLKSRPLNVSTMILLELWLELVSPYILWNLVTLILPITDLVCRLADELRDICASKGIKEMTIPHMDEFYDFLCLDQEYVLSRKSWY
jgi:hypothetical protein